MASFLQTEDSKKNILNRLEFVIKTRFEDIKNKLYNSLKNIMNLKDFLHRTNFQKSSFEKRIY